MEKLADLVHDLARTICCVLGGHVPQEDDDTFFDAMSTVLFAYSSTYRPSIAYQVLVFFFGATNAHIILMRFHRFLSNRRIRR